jgi:hypothetical protein
LSEIDQVVELGFRLTLIADTRSEHRASRGIVPKAAAVVLPSLSPSGETLTIEELLTLRARTETLVDVGPRQERSWTCG